MRLRDQTARGQTLRGLAGARCPGVDPKIRQEQFGDAAKAMTDHYMHILT
jgi:hypothetical protein